MFSTTTILLTCIILLVVSGCNGRLYTVKDPQFHQGKTDGIIFYQPKPVVLVFQTNQLHDKQGNVIATAKDGGCIPEENFEVTSLPDYSVAYALVYAPGIFETRKFSVELEKGVVKAVNTESTSAARETLDIVQGILGTIKEMKPLTVPPSIEPDKKPEPDKKQTILQRWKNVYRSQVL